MQVGDQFPIEELGLSKGDGPAVVWAAGDSPTHVEEGVERCSTPT